MAKPYDITRAFKRVEDDLIRSMIRNLEKHKVDEVTEQKQWEQWQALQLKELERYRQRNIERFRPEFQDINEKIQDLYFTTATDAQLKEEAKILKAIEKGDYEPTAPTDTSLDAKFFGVNEARLNALQDATQADFNKAEYAILRRANDQYRQIIFDAQVYASVGSYAKAVDMATKDFLQAGINCVVYKNGSRHTLEDYSSMAIRTGQKRAYLMGEGNARYKYDIHTVRVNRRQDACPVCAPWVDRVLVDDVYGGGTAEEAMRLNLPTLSDAMAEGFLHPNCKDIYSTYYEGISEPAKPWTKEELQEIADRYNTDQKIKHAEDMQESYQRMADYSLDPANKALYQARADEWDKKAEKFKNNSALPKSALSALSSNNVASSSVRVYTDDELKEAYLRYSSGGENYILNEALRNRQFGKLPKDQKEWVYALDEAIKRAPKYEGEVYRSLNITDAEALDAFLTKHRIGQPIQYHQFLSTGVVVYDDSFNVQLIIQSKTGADFRALNPEEQEILFGRKVKFKVTNREGNKIWLTEI